MDESIKFVGTFGDVSWWLNDKMHRVDGPAIEMHDGSKAWLRHGLRHREDGPAIVWANGDRQWFLNDINYDPIEWMLKVHELKNGR